MSTSVRLPIFQFLLSSVDTNINASVRLILVLPVVNTIITMETARVDGASPTSNDVTARCAAAAAAPADVVETE